MAQYSTEFNMVHGMPNSGNRSGNSRPRDAPAQPAEGQEPHVKKHWNDSEVRIIRINLLGRSSLRDPYGQHLLRTTLEQCNRNRDPGTPPTTIEQFRNKLKSLRHAEAKSKHEARAVDLEHALEDVHFLCEDLKAAKRKNLDLEERLVAAEDSIRATKDVLAKEQESKQMELTLAEERLQASAQKFEQEIRLAVDELEVAKQELDKQNRLSAPEKLRAMKLQRDSSREETRRAAEKIQSLECQLEEEQKLRRKDAWLADQKLQALTATLEKYEGMKREMRDMLVAHTSEKGKGA